MVDSCVGIVPAARQSAILFVALRSWVEERGYVWPAFFN
jgi:hypothetical protein